MEELSKNAHWENVYNTKKFEEVSWYIDTPTYFVKLISDLSIPKDANIIDIGCGESKLLENLHQKGYHHLSGLDISQKSIEKNKITFSHLTPNINWIVADISTFEPSEKYYLWHDRAVFHFLTEDNEINHYKEIVSNNITHHGYFILSTFSKNGPLKCSGLEIKQYNHEDIEKTFGENFDILHQEYIEHQTPFDTIQNFQVSVLKRK
jgi:2-polyprenyl-3-methyl-5-hydroxy-6-metoxy-1,4-benzoquinol methylase